MLMYNAGNDFGDNVSIDEAVVRALRSRQDKNPAVAEMLGRLIEELHASHTLTDVQVEAIVENGWIKAHPIPSLYYHSKG